MIRTPINKDIGKIRNKDVLMFTWREAIYSGIAMVCGLVIYGLLYPYIGISMAAWIAMFVVMPIATTGFFCFNGLRLGDIAKAIIFNPGPLVFGGNFEEEKNELIKETQRLRKEEMQRESNEKGVRHGFKRLQKGRRA